MYVLTNVLKDSSQQYGSGIGWDISDAAASSDTEWTRRRSHSRMLNFGATRTVFYIIRTVSGMIQESTKSFLFQMISRLAIMFDRGLNKDIHT